MSFLAQLRQQQPDNEQGLTLCYLLNIDPQQHSAVLTLSLAQLRQGRIANQGKPYSIQQAHLQCPPAFLSDADVHLLQTLVNADSHWLQCSTGKLPAHNSWVFVQALLDSQHCFIEHSPGCWITLVAGEEQLTGLYWKVNAAGEQQLSWRRQRNSTLFYSSNPCSQAFVYDRGNHSLARTCHTLSANAVKAALPWFSQPLPPDAVPGFLEQHSQWSSLNLPLPVEIPIKDGSTDLVPLVHCETIHDPNGGLKDVLQLRFRYSSAGYCFCITADSNDNDCRYWDGTQLIVLQRQPEQECRRQSQLSDVLASFISVDKQTWYTEDEQAWRNFFAEAYTALQSLGFRFSFARGFRHHYVIVKRWQVQLHNRNDERWQLSVKLSADGEPIDLLALLAQLKTLDNGNDLSRLQLQDGRLLLLPAQKLSGLMEELGDLLLYTRADTNGVYCLPNAQINRLHTLHQQLPNDTEWQGDVALLEQALTLHQTPALLNQENCSINAELRPYQWHGVCWLQHSKQHGISGLLADDMGLGKTLQTLAHLCLEHQQGKLRHPALIIAPTSLLHNWAAEIKRFAPHLRSRLMHGPQRHQHWPQLNDADIVISSYALIANDLAHWQQQALSWVVLDEAQCIKNPRTQASQAVRQLNSHHRLCLSGTPVENHLGELWSILDFLMPGCLGSANEFKRYFQKPIEQHADSNRLQQLLQRVAPFMLRRNKDQVAADLPTKTEIYQSISMADDQRQFYDELKTSGWSELQQRIEDTPEGQQQILVLTALLKLRQACCDPQLLGATDISSSKREHCIDMIEELVAEQRAILVFSQFTTMLELLAEALENKGIDYLILSGQTRKRETLVEAFQQGRVPVFLISLKAGGVGLNLTRADTVIHYDPWWNSAAQQQATDRAHRIGQDKPVFVYKLIAENTIEEKIAELQQRKALLSQHVSDQAQAHGEQFALKLDELLALWEQD